MNVIQQQLDISKSLLTALDSMLSMYQNNTASTFDQASSISSAVESMSDRADDMSAAAASSQKMSQSLNNVASSKEVAEKIISSNEKVSKDMTKSMDDASSKVTGSTSSLEKQTKDIAKSKKDIAKSGKLLNVTEDLHTSLDKTSEDILTIKDTVKKQTFFISMLSKIVSMFAKIKDAIVTGGISLIKDIPALLLSFTKTAFDMFASLIGGMTKFFIFTTTLPLTIAKVAVGIGNQIRTDLVEVIQSAGEEAKESFDLTSGIGQGADKMTQTAKGMLKTFQNPRSRLVKLFDMGAAGAAAFLKESFKAVADMGHYSEIFGPSILNSTENGQFVIEMQRGLGIGAQEMAYYAMQAYNSGEHPIKTLARTSDAIREVADRNDQDFKALAKDFHKLRTNIVDFGSLTTNEIANLVGKLRSMKVKTEDAVNVFKKFTSFEEAAKASAMLFQSFEMNVDAFDLLTARDPGEMLQQFRDAMFQTGRSFKDLNRHEKALMASITGVSEQGLSSLMNYMDLGLTQDEARKKLEAQDPTKEQTKMIKGLTSTIKLLQKTMTFKSPFEAFFAGLSENIMNHKGLQTKLISLSKVYADIKQVGFKLKLSRVSAALKPMVKVLTRIDEVVNGDGFKNMMKITTETAGRFLTHFSYDIETDPEKLKGIKKLSVEERIDELYRDLKNMTSTGGPLFENMATIGGKIMGGIIKGAVLGITAAFHMLAGGVSMSVEALGLTVTEEMKRDASKKGITNMKNYTILDWLGIGEADAEGIKTSLGDAIGDLVLQLPSLMSMAGTLLEDLSEVFLKFAASVLGVMGDMTLAYYNESNFATKGAMRLMGFNVEAARAASSGVGVGKSGETNVIDLILKTRQKGKMKEGFIGTYVSYIEDLKNAFPQGSPAHSFLNNPKTAKNINYLKDTGNYKWKTLGDSVDDAEEPQRAQAILDIAKKAYQVNAVLPADVFTLFNGAKKKPKWYNKDLNFANKRSKELIEALKPADEVGDFFGGLSNDPKQIESKSLEVERARALESMTINRLIKQKKIELGLNKKLAIPSNAQDIEYTGKNTVLITPDNIFYLDDFDTVLAAKRGGFLNRLFIGLTEHFNETQENSRIKIIQLTSLVDEATASASVLSNNTIDRNSLDFEADDETYNKIFSAYDEVIDLILNKDLNNIKTQIKFNA